MRDIWEHLLLTPLQAVQVVMSAVGIYIVFLLLIRLLGQRAAASLSSFDFAAVLALGAVAGRAILGYTPTLGAGVVALMTLFAMQGIVGQLRRRPWGARLVRNPPVLLMAGDRIIEDNLVRCHIIDEELWGKLREAGVRNRSEVSCVILESTGAMSILRRGALIDASTLHGVLGAELMPDALIRPADPTL